MGAHNRFAVGMQRFRSMNDAVGLHEGCAARGLPEEKLELLEDVTTLTRWE